MLAAGLSATDWYEMYVMSHLLLTYICRTLHRLLRQLLSHLHKWDVLSAAALETWRYNTSDVTAVKDVSTWLDELKEQEENADRSP